MYHVVDKRKGKDKMNAAEIILLILGFASISVSFFIGRREKAPEVSGNEPEVRSRDIWTEKEEEMVKNQIQTILAEEQEAIIAETSDSLNRKSNEKIMEFDEFSNQVLEKINHNHEEVVFMYSMLSEKEKEWKEQAVRQARKKEAHKNVDSGEETPDLPKKVKKEAVKEPAEEPKKKVQTEQIKDMEPEPERKTVTGEDGATGVNDRIIAMHKQGKSVLEISKELNVGQGEVRLTIALYGGNK